MAFDFESFPEFEFVNQDIDDDIKLQMLFAELHRVERTLEIHGSPYVFVEDENVRFSVDSGKKRFENHRAWLQETICSESWDNTISCNRMELLRTILDLISLRDIHPYVVLILAQIVTLRGPQHLCAGAWNA
ncbi:MAG: hypothetical protein ACE5QF_09130 [Thermoplasmata archaeon]